MRRMRMVGNELIGMVNLLGALRGNHTCVNSMMALILICGMITEVDSSVARNTRPSTCSCHLV